MIRCHLLSGSNFILLKLKNNTIKARYKTASHNENSEANRGHFVRENPEIVL